MCFILFFVISSYYYGILVCHIDLSFIFVFRDFVVLLQRLILYRRLVTAFCFSLSCCDVLFVCVRFKQIKHIRSNIHNKSNYGHQYVAKLES